MKNPDRLTVAKGLDLTLGPLLRDKRHALDVSLGDFAKIAGCSKSYLSQIERGNYKASARIAKAYAELLGLDEETLQRAYGNVTIEERTAAILKLTEGEP